MLYLRSRSSRYFTCSSEPLVLSTGEEERSEDEVLDRAKNEVKGEEALRLGSVFFAKCPEQRRRKYSDDEVPGAKGELEEEMELLSLELLLPGPVKFARRRGIPKNAEAGFCAIYREPLSGK